MADHDKELANAEAALREQISLRDQRIAELEAVLMAIDHSIPVTTVSAALTRGGELKPLETYFNTIVDKCIEQSEKFRGGHIATIAMTALKHKPEDKQGDPG
jgi:hypothetical protein